MELPLVSTEQESENKQLSTKTLSDLVSTGQYDLNVYDRLIFSSPTNLVFCIIYEARHYR
jgi:hypothetical protein